MLTAVDDAFAAHDPGRGHPDRPERLDAVAEGLRRAGLADPAARLTPRRATRAELETVHPSSYLDRLEATCRSGGGRLDADTVASSASWDAAVLAAGAGLAAVEQLQAGLADAAFLAVRPPGHHAVPAGSMGFCLVNNIAVCARQLVGAGNRVLIVDWDAHHGNGTQDIFWDEPTVMYVSTHQWPLYPGTGAPDEIGGPLARGTTVNVPLVPGATGDVVERAFDDIVEPRVAAFAPDWVLVSAGYDAHRADPITDLGWSAGDYVELTQRVVDFAPSGGRTIVFLEGGYDLEALRDGVEATATTLLGRSVAAEPRSSGGPGADLVERVRDFWTRIDD